MMDCHVGLSLSPAGGGNDDAPGQPPNSESSLQQRLAQYTPERSDAKGPTHAQGFADIYSKVHSAACSITSLARLMHAALCHDTGFYPCTC